MIKYYSRSTDLKKLFHLLLIVLLLFADEVCVIESLQIGDKSATEVNEDTTDVSDSVQTVTEDIEASCTS